MRKHNQAVRTWARQHGYGISERGRIPSEVVSAYASAQGPLDVGTAAVRFSG